VPARIVTRTPPLGSGAANPTAQTELVPPSTMPARRPITQPPPPPAKRASQSGPLPHPSTTAGAGGPQGNRSTAAWATDGVKPEVGSQTAPFVGRASAVTDEPAFAGRVRVSPGDESSFQTGKVRSVDDDEDLIPGRRGSRAGMWVLVMALLVMGASAAVVYVFVIRKGKDQVAAKPPPDAAIARATPDAAPIVITPVIDAAPAPPPSPLEVARGELGGDVELRLRTAIQSLDGKDEPAAQALHAHLIAQLAQDLVDRASVSDRLEGDKLRKEAKQLVLDAATLAQRAFKATGDDPGANLAMAEVLRLQGKSARDIKRYLDTAKAKADKDWTREIALAEALGLVRDGKLDDARVAFAAIDNGDGKLDSSGDVRARFHLALVDFAQNKAADAKPLVDTVLAAQADHAAAKALSARLETVVAKTDAMPPEDRKDAGVGPATPIPIPTPDLGGDYDHLVARANALAETSCAKAMDLFAKALEQKPNGVEALTGEGYCHIDAKQFASAFSKFRAALAVSAKYEPALWGFAEAYQQQGRREQAIEAYKAYLEVYPDAAKAKRQLELLGATSAPTPPPSNGSGSAVAPPPDPGAGAGSG
jgi:hypothetical protein